MQFHDNPTERIVEREEPDLAEALQLDDRGRLRFVEDVLSEARVRLAFQLRALLREGSHAEINEVARTLGAITPVPES